ncbi:hypothetical protein CFAM422_001584 [Trichoderma lentiforme]|uniref:Uncharacterized protein n=1 Tax=Trichoderma lentiforme TaxID=1567552 RepID=A0A9P4XM94_9HYPO|nr:hypothetical protein CFAM422_001584 [Trichoderma lentiforme]
MKPVFGVVGDEAIPRRIMKDCAGTEGGYGLIMVLELLQLDGNYHDGTGCLRRSGNGILKAIYGHQISATGFLSACYNAILQFQAGRVRQPIDL